MNSSYYTGSIRQKFFLNYGKVSRLQNDDSDNADMMCYVKSYKTHDSLPHKKFHAMTSFMDTLPTILHNWHFI